MTDQLKNKKIYKGAIVGFGFISSSGHLPAYLERAQSKGDVKIVAICDVCQERSLYIPKGIRFYTDYKKMIQDEELDFVDVSTHASEHYAVAKFALEEKKHVLCEKPLTVSIEEALDLIKFAIRQKRVLFPCHNYKFAPVVTEIRRHIESGVIGKVRSVTMNTFRNTHALGTREWNPDWRRYQHLSGGGIAMDHGSHSLYLAFEWLRGYPKSVTASSVNFAYPRFDTEDNFSAVFEFDEGLANIHLSWTAGIRKVLYSIQGEKGGIVVDDDHLELSVMKNADQINGSYRAHWQSEKYKVKSDWMDSSHVSWFNNMFDQFLAAIMDNDFKNKELMDAFYSVYSIKKSYHSILNNSEKTNLKISDPFES